MNLYKLQYFISNEKKKRTAYTQADNYGKAEENLLSKLRIDKLLIGNNVKIVFIEDLGNLI